MENITYDELWHIHAYTEWKEHHRYPWEWQLDGDTSRYPEDWIALHRMRDMEIEAQNRQNFNEQLKQAERENAAKMRGTY